MGRDSFKSRIGFILVSAGCAIGIGNVWKFPYLAGQNGGGIFVLLYLFFLVIMAFVYVTQGMWIIRWVVGAVLGILELMQIKKRKVLI